ncbi:MAG: ATP-binding protein [Clostridiaceae bacterium]|jgi:predicted AAA+ superfamily ATPase|nr:ATP-binding protein [Clostridiaceae bacterium]
MIQRKEYLDRLIAWKDKHVIKVITGIRRCGKSSLLELFKEYLTESCGVDSAQIIAVDFENMSNTHLRDKHVLHEYVISLIQPGKKSYVFFDEIQNVADFEQVVDSLFLRKELDIYITGSNAFFLSGELATLLSGRYITIEMLPLSFAEYSTATKDNKSVSSKYREYIERSSFPYVTELAGDKKNTDDYLRGIYSTVVLKDIMQHNKFNDLMQLESVLRFLYDNIANLLSTKSIADTMTSNGRKIDVKTVEKYLSAFTNSFIIYQAKRYDIKGKQYLKTLEKYYATDIGLRFTLLGRQNYDEGRILENIVYLELLRRGYDVYVGKVDSKEVDFVAVTSQGTAYFQVAATVRNQATLERELASLKAITDHYPKLLLTLDDTPETNFGGIRKLNVLDWLLDK